MNPSKISEEQEWQLFELLEGNLTKPAAEELFKAMGDDANLKAHYDALAQTYLQPTTTLYPDASSLKKKAFNRTVLFYASMSAAATLAIIWFFRASIATQPIAPTQTQVAKSTLSVDETSPSTTASKPFKIQSALGEMKQGAEVIQNHIAKKTSWEMNTEGTDNSNNLAIHPLITATEPIRKVKNINDSSFRRGTEVLASQNNPNASNKLYPSEAIQTAIAQRTPKTRKELLKSFYHDARRMVENGHLPHIKVKTVNKDQDWMPEFQVGLTLENNVILTSFNPE